MVTCVAAVRMPLAEALTCFRDLLAPEHPGGRGLYRAHDPIDVLLDGVSVVLNPLIGWCVTGTPCAAAGVYDCGDHARHHDVRGDRCGGPARPAGARLRRRLLWRYTLVWRKP